jgi:hypothetical protein
MVKVGLRKPSLTKSLSARTKGRATRAIKKSIIPGYGQKGMGWAHPKRKLYNTIYSKTTVDTRKLFVNNKPNNNGNNQTNSSPEEQVQVTGNVTYILAIIQFLFNCFSYYGRYLRTISGWAFIPLAVIWPRVATYALVIWIVLWFATIFGLVSKNTPQPHFPTKY